MSSNQTSTGELPRRLGRYVLLSRLTEGGMTEVYAARLAEEVGPGRMLVIKVLPDAVADDPQAESRFLAEARIVLNLTHGNITTAFEFGRDDARRPFLVMEYVPGPSLRGLLGAIHRGHGQLPVADALFIVGEVAKALSYAHGFSSGGTPKGLIHRDISPDNIVISTSGQVKLTDFGIAHFLESRTFGPIFGKAAYIAPEVAAGKTPSSASDIYSLGAVLYECLSGHPPFYGDDDREILKRVTTQDAPPIDMVRDGLSPELASLVMSLLNKAPENRPANAATLVLKIHGLLRAIHKTYTESVLAVTVHARFSESDFMDPTPRESLKKTLEEVGIDLSGEETTDELLENRTVRLSEIPDKSGATRKKRPPRRLRLAVGVGVLTTAIAVAVGLFGRSSQPSTPQASTPAPVSTHTPTGMRTPTEPLADPLPTEKGVIQSDAAVASPDAAVASSHTDTPHPVTSQAAPKAATPKTSRKGKRPKTAGGEAKHPKDGPVKNIGATEEWGWLNINSYPWSYVIVDGKRLPGHTPHRRVKLRAGRHVLAFENPELGLQSKKTVEVMPWEEANIGVRLDK